MSNVHDNDDNEYDDDEKKSEKLTWAFGSGKLKTYSFHIHMQSIQQIWSVLPDLFEPEIFKHDVMLFIVFGNYHFVHIGNGLYRYMCHRSRPRLLWIVAGNFDYFSH